MLNGLSYADIALLFAAGAAGAAVNAVAGGGTFITFPAFLATGVPPVIANTSNAVALWPGRLAAIAAYLGELERQRERALWTGAVCLAGGVAGAWLLLRTGDALFLSLVPWLLLAASLLLAFDRPMQEQFGAPAGAARPSRLKIAVLALPLFAVAVYGGFFGGGLGVMLLPILALSGVRDVQEMNGLKNLLVTLVTSVAVIGFIVAGKVAWPGALAMMAGATLGGFAGASLARRLPGEALRKTIVAFGFALSAFYFHKVYLA